MSREQLIEILTPALVKSGYTETEVRDVLETYTAEGLDKELQRQQRARLHPGSEDKRQRQIQILGDRNREDLAWTHISRVIVNGKMLITNEANRQIVFGWLHEDQGEQPTVEWFKKVLEENPALKNQITWEPVLSPEQRKQAAAQQLKQDIETFAEICRRHSISECQANFSLWRGSRSIEGLAPANQAERDQYRQEAVEAHNQELLRVAETDPSKLRVIVRQEAADTRAQQAQADADRQLKAAQERDSHFGFPKLPDTWNGQTLDSAFIKNCSVEIHKFLTKRFGSAQLTARLRGAA
jgi:hypothetical protein